MTLGQLVHVLRWSFACAVLLAGSVIGLFVLLMMREGIPRTEGSPAGAVIAAVLLASVLAAPILLIAGAALVFKLAKRPWPQPESGQPLSLIERDCLEALKAWRAEVARSHNLPAFVIFHDSTLRALAQRRPSQMDDLDGVAGIGQKKREAYGAEVLRVMAPFVD